MNIRETLIHAVTRFDAKESTKRGYNRNALGIYFNRVDDICADIENGADPRAAIVAGFSGRLADACLKACNLTAYTREDALGGPVCYTQVSARNP